MACKNGHQILPGDQCCRECCSPDVNAVFPTTIPGSVRPRQAQPLRIPSILFFLAAALAMVADYAPAVTAPGLSAVTTYNLGPDFTSITASGLFLLFTIWSIAVGSRTARGAAIHEWAFWLRLAVGIAFLIETLDFFDVCRNWVRHFGMAHRGLLAQMSIAPFVALIGASMFLAGAVWQTIASPRAR